MDMAVASAVPAPRANIDRREGRSLVFLKVQVSFHVMARVLLGTSRRIDWFQFDQISQQVEYGNTRVASRQVQLRVLTPAISAEALPHESGLADNFPLTLKELSDACIVLR
ncbi:hypothetical protein ACIGW8_39080 [Streptomyces sioyaensis]|uniref:hypothetical protein n=1 Tax=Streptomyces sioyaensis TaxID=67364 RepID=UPI0037D3A8CD